MLPTMEQVISIRVDTIRAQADAIRDIATVALLGDLTIDDLSEEGEARYKRIHALADHVKSLANEVEEADSATSTSFDLLRANTALEYFDDYARKVVIPS